MFTIHNGLGGHAAHMEWQPTKAMRLAALLGALAVASFAVNSLIVVADGTLRQRSPAAGGCQADLQRQSCAPVCASACKGRQRAGTFSLLTG